MTAGAAIVNSPRLQREGRPRHPVNVMPACLACGSAYVDCYDVWIATGADVNGEVHSPDGYRYVAMWSCRTCGFLASGTAVTS